MQHDQASTEPSKDDLALIGKLFIDYCSMQGIPMPPDKFIQNKAQLAKKLNIEEPKLTEIYYLLFDLSVKATLSDAERNKIGFKQQ